MGERSPIVLVTVLVVKIDTTTKATNKGRHLIWGSFYSFITIMIWWGPWWQAGMAVEQQMRDHI